MSAAPLLERLAKLLAELGLDAVMMNACEAGRPIVRRTKPYWPSWRRRLKKETKKVSRAAELKAVQAENELAIRDMIRRWKALPMNQRVHFLRRRLPNGGTAL